MPLILEIIFFFLFSLSAGTQLFQPLVRSELTGVGFYKLGLSLVLSSLILMAAIIFHYGFDLTQLIVWAFLFFSNLYTYFKHRDQKTIMMWIIYLLQIMIWTYWIYLLSTHERIDVSMLISSILLFGIANFSMILGHYYLVVPKLSEKPLLLSIYVLWCALVVKIILNVYTLSQPSIQAFFLEGSVVAEGYLWNWIFYLMRVLWGIVATFILSIFAYKLTKMRSIQSATGVLYIIEFFVIVGEMLGLFFSLKHGLHS